MIHTLASFDFAVGVAAGYSLAALIVVLVNMVEQLNVARKILSYNDDEDEPEFLDWNGDV